MPTPTQPTPLPCCPGKTEALDIFKRYDPTIGSQIVQARRSLTQLATNTKIPRLDHMARQHGTTLALDWLRLQVSGVVDFVGRGQDLTDTQRTELVRMLYGLGSQLNLAEYAYFFACYKLGRYGEVYGSLDPQRVCRAFEAFLLKRRLELEQYWRQKEDEEERQRQERSRLYSITHEEYLALEALAEAGDQGALFIRNHPETLAVDIRAYLALKAKGEKSEDNTDQAEG